MSAGSVRPVHMTRCGLGWLHQFNVHCHFDDKDSHRKFVIPGLRFAYVQNGGRERDGGGGGGQHHHRQSPPPLPPLIPISSNPALYII